MADGNKDLAIALRLPGRVSVSYVTLLIGQQCSRFLLGDVNLDGVINLLDVAPFIELLQAGDFQVEADIIGAVDLLDVVPFVDLLTSG